MAKKSLCMAYLLWLTGGIIGLHHFYLGRDRQAFLYWMSLGGYFGFGWLSDLWMIPDYVKDANNEENYMEKLAKKMHESPRPPNSTFRYLVQIAVADALGFLALAALPRELINESFVPFAEILAPFAVAVGIHLVGNIGRQQGSLIYALIGSLATYPMYLIGYRSVVFTSFCSAYVFNTYGRQWRRTPTKSPPFFKRCLVLGICTLLYLSLWSSFLYFNLTIVSEGNEEVKFRDAVKHFFKSPLWQEFLSVVSHVWDVGKQHGWKEVWQQIILSLDPQGKGNALKVLGLDSKATEQEITSRYRELSRQWHPDRHKDLLKKEEAQERFIEIAQSYEILMAAYREARSVNDEL